MLTYTEVTKNKVYSVILIFIFLLVIIGMGYFAAYFYNAPILLVIAVIFSSVSAIISYYFSDKITLAMSGAKQIDLNSHPQLYRIVENLSIAAGLPMPRVYVIESPALNAFATGRNPKNAVICVTTGLLTRLEQSELEGVLAHELSHIGNYDIRFMTLVVVLVGVVTLLADGLMRIQIFGGRDRDSRSSNGYLFFIGLALMILSPIIAMLIQLAVSRKREFLADASGALMTRYPEGLAAALEKIGGDKQPLETANNATAHLFISNPFKENDEHSNWLAGLFNTHPPIQERIKRLREMGR